MTNSAHTVLGGRYKLTGEIARSSSTLVRRAWDRWLNRYVSIKILPNSKIACEAAKRGFIGSAGALTRIDHPHVEPLLDYGATAEGAPYHVMPAREGSTLAMVLAAEGPMPWATVQALLLGILAGVDALHQQCVVHREIALHTIVVTDHWARLVDFDDAELCAEAPTLAQQRDDLLGVATVGFALLTGVRPNHRDALSPKARLARTDAPSAVQAMLLSVLADDGKQAPNPIDIVELRQIILGASPRPRPSLGIVNSAAAVAAVVMLVLGVWASFAELREIGRSAGPAASRDSAVMGSALEPPTLGHELGHDPSVDDQRDLAELAATPASTDQAGLGEYAILEIDAPTTRAFEPSRAHLEVGSEARGGQLTIQSRSFDLSRTLSPALLVERGIDLTHGRPIPEDDPRLPVQDGPARARVLFEAACARDFGKGCHMLGVQIAEGMITDDDGAGPAEHYARGCDLDYPRSCAALADLARIGTAVADVSLLETKACLLAGPNSSYCRR